MKKKYVICILVIIAFQIGFCLAILLSLKKEQSYKKVNLAPESIIEATNALRISHGKKSLSNNILLTNVAQKRAEKIISNGSFSHSIPGEKTAWDLLRQNGYEYSFAAENLAIHYNNVNDLMNAWLASPKHKDNLLNPESTEIGIAVVPLRQSLHYSHVIVQIMALPVSRE